MSQSNVEKVHTLLSHEEIETVNQGFGLIASLVNTEEELRAFIPYPQDCSDVETLGKGIKEQGWKHGNYIKVWFLGFLAGLDVPWVLEINRLNLGWNGLVALPHTIEKLRSLTHLVLSRNPRLKIPNSVFSLPNLKQLDVRGCDVVQP